MTGQNGEPGHHNALWAIMAAFGTSMLAGLVLGAFLWQPVMPGRCLPGSRGRVCVQARPDQLTAHVVADEPTATAIPGIVTPADVVWLQASGFLDAGSVRLTLTAADGTVCEIAAAEVEADPVTVDGPGVQAFITPTSCSDAEGVWTATFTDTVGEHAEARFLVVQP